MTLDEQLAIAFLQQHPSQAALALERMPIEQQIEVVRLAPDESAGALREMMPGAAAACLARLEPERAATVVARLGIDAAVALVRRLPPDAAERVLAAVPPHTQDELRRVLRFPDGTAGALMDPAVLALPDDITAANARLRLRRASRDLLYYLYVVDREQRLIGVMDIPELMRAHSRDPVRMVMHADVQRIAAWTPTGAVHRHSGWQSFHAMPVVDERDRLIGAIRYHTLRRIELDAAGDRAGQPAAQTAAALGELFRVGVAGLVDAVAAGGTSTRARELSPPGGGA